MRGATRRLLTGIAAIAASVSVSCGDGATRKEILETEEKIYSQGQEEVIIRDFFQDRRGGFFLDIGCADPVRNSTTYYLEKHLGWSGIGVDALPRYSEPYRRKRPGTRFLNYIVTDHAGTLDEFYHVKAAPDLSSTIKEREFGGKRLEAETIRVPTITLNDLLEGAGVEKIDFLSMDIERGAPKALAGFDIERFEPSLVCIEAGAGEDYRETIKRYFSEHGYQRIERYLKHDPNNWYYTPAQ
jgi:FkbM family methyltransferase